MSALSPSATRQITSPVAGLTVSNVLPLALGTHLPSMNINWSLTCGGLTERDLGAVAVAMFGPRGEVSGRLREALRSLSAGLGACQGTAGTPGRGRRASPPGGRIPGTDAPPGPDTEP